MREYWKLTLITEKKRGCECADCIFQRARYEEMYGEAFDA